MTSYELKDSGNHQNYESGMRRSSEEGKPRFDLIRTKLQPYEEQMVYRYAVRLSKGAAVYDARNWEEGGGQEELDHAISSLLRHVEQLVAGETDEDHAAAVWFNAQAIEYFRWRMAQNEPKTDEEAQARERAKRASEIHQAALQEAFKIRRRERLLESAKELDAELTEDARKLAEEADANRPVPAAQRHLLQDAQLPAAGHRDGGLPVAGYAARWINDYEPGSDDTVLGFDGTKDGTIVRGIVKNIDDHLRVHLDGPSAPPLPFQQPAPLEPGFLKRFGYDSVKVDEAEFVQEPSIADYARSAMDANVRKREAELWNKLPKPWEKVPDSLAVGEWPEARFQKGDKVKIEARWFSLQPNALSATIDSYLPKSFENMPGHFMDQYLVRIWDPWHKSYEIVADMALYQALDPAKQGE